MGIKTINFGFQCIICNPLADRPSELKRWEWVALWVTPRRGAVPELAEAWSDYLKQFKGSLALPGKDRQSKQTGFSVFHGDIWEQFPTRDTIFGRLPLKSSLTW